MKSYLYKGAKTVKLGKFLSEMMPGLSFSSFKRLLSDGRVKVNSKRVKKEIYVNPGDTVEVYGADGAPSFRSESVYEDNNVLLAVKPRGIETKNFAVLVSEERGTQFIPVHRLDTNTGGIVMLAKSEAAFRAAVELFKKHLVDKEYMALLCGAPEKNGVYTAYLKKDPKQGVVEVAAVKKPGFEEIKTGIELVEMRDAEIALCRIKLYTGKTHQIRAHTAFLGHPVLGDTKYGNFELNRLSRAKRQYLTAVKLSFGSIPKGNILSALSGKSFEIPCDF